MTGPVWTGRGLRLPAPPDPEHAAELAQCAVDAARNVDGFELDYTPASLSLVDGILEKFREPGSDAVAETIFVFGCYVGEVLVRNAGYEWVDTPPEVARYTFPLTIYRASTAAHANPIGKAFERVDNGDTDSVTYFYSVFSTDTEPGLMGPERPTPASESISAADGTVPFVANNKFRLSAEDIVPGLAPEDGCMATDRILVDGSPVGYMYRDGSGWVFTAGDETPEYLAEPGHVNLLSLNEIANYDRVILPYLQAPPGAAFIRHGDAFVEDPEGAPREPDEPTPPALNPQFPVVSGDHELAESWVLTVPEPMNFRIDQDAGSSRAVFWRPGLTAMLTPWGNPRNDAPAVRLQQVTMSHRTGLTTPSGWTTVCTT